MASYWDRDRASLLHPTYGDAARNIRDAIGVGTAGKMRELAAGLDRMNRVAALDIREFRGVYLEGRDERITPDHNKFIGVLCPDGSVTITNDDDNPHVIKICADPAIIAEYIDCEYLGSLGCVCTKGIRTIYADNSSQDGPCDLDDGCENQLWLTGGRCIATSCSGLGGGQDGVGVTIENTMTIESCGLCVDFDPQECVYNLDLDVVLDNETPYGSTNTPNNDGARWARICACNGVRYWFRAVRQAGVDCCE